MTKEYEEFLEEIVGEDFVLQRDSSVYKAMHEEFDEPLELMTHKGNLSRHAAYILEQEFDVDTDYSFSQLHQAENILSSRGIIKNGEIAAEIPYSWAKLYSDDDKNIFDNGTAFGELVEQYGNEVAKIIDKKGKNYISSSEIAKELEISANQVSRVLRALAEEEDVGEEIVQFYTNTATWNVGLLGYDTNTE